MTKKLLEELEQKLKEKKAALEKDLRAFAKKDPKLKGDWDSNFPKYNGGTGGQNLEDAADEVEEYTHRLSIEYNLETRLKDINLALEKIKRGHFGTCENCKKKISLERLKVCPEAKLCLKCEKK